MPKSQTTSGSDLVLDLDAVGPGALHERLKRALRAAIRSGRLATGATLPASRALALDLGCSRWAVTEAYAQLTAEAAWHTTPLDGGRLATLHRPRRRG